jgi:hypothetical protein
MLLAISVALSLAEPPASAPVPAPRPVRSTVRERILAERATPKPYTKGRRIASQTLLWTSAGLSLSTFIGHAATSIPAITGHYWPDETSLYWRNRLLASQILGSTGLALTTAAHVAGAILHRSGIPARRRAGRILTIMSIVPHVVSAIVVPVLTPRDWSHGVLHGVSAAMSATGLAIAW